MSSNQAIDLSGSLPQMKPLSPNTFLYEPPSAAPDPNSPKLVALFSWMSAQDVHIAKYTSRYMALYPTARILLVKCPFIHTLSPRISKREIRPAVSVVRALADATPRTETRPQLLLHVFSNGGATNLAKFYDLYSEAEPRSGGKLQLPPHVTVYDSCPGGFHWMRSYRALSAAFPRLLAPFVHVFIGWFWLLQVPFGRTGFFGRMWAALKQKALLQSEQRRVYLYSREDEMIYWGDVEKHANESKEVGFKVSRERFEGSKHVAHARLDGERYWKAVKGLWEGQTEGKTQTPGAKVDVKPEEVKPEEAKAEVKSELETVAETDAEVPTAKEPEVTNGFEIVEKPEVAKQAEEVKHLEGVMNGAAVEEQRQPAKESEIAKEPPKQPEAVAPEVVAPEAVRPEAARPEPVRRKKAPTPPPTIQ
ncbi:hypothetical protein CMUS01_04058 [Colletotrichum musicola]|uniref:Indole-diterpene biosynthesis protein PaxU n=1 Tax=Colletotrichum musicola TaxID=2175873 RepID=A0A8H6NP97_9PEZI|nr:hypothetical protein CMUS01_04058 [Colletotrichum musicola]